MYCLNFPRIKYQTAVGKYKLIFPSSNKLKVCSSKSQWLVLHRTHRKNLVLFCKWLKTAKTKHNFMKWINLLNAFASKVKISYCHRKAHRRKISPVIIRKKKSKSFFPFKRNFEKMRDSLQHINKKKDLSLETSDTINLVTKLMLLEKFSEAKQLNIQ